MKRIAPLTEVERETLRWAWREGPTARMRQRAQAVYQSDRGRTRLELAQWFEVDADTVTAWLDGWERDGLRGLYDAPRSGRPSRYTAVEQAQLCQWVEEEPRQRKQAQARLVEATGRTASDQTVQRILKKKGMSGSGCAGR